MKRYSFKSRRFFLILVSVAIALSFLLFPVRSGQVAVLASQHQNERPIPTAIAQMEPSMKVTGETVEYATIEGQTITGYFARPESAAADLPGILAIHEWWGLNDNIKAMARRLAGEGYQVLAVDLYNGQVAPSPQEARQLTESVQKNPAAAKDNLQQAYQYLAQEKKAPKIGVIGWCFGGSWSLQTAMLFPQDIDATVIYYGGQIGEATAADLKPLEMPILGIFGANDASIPLADVKKFETLLTRLGKEAEIEIYENAGHAFANPSGERYVAEAAEKAWEKTIEFLGNYLKN